MGGLVGGLAFSKAEALLPRLHVNAEYTVADLNTLLSRSNLPRFNQACAINKTPRPPRREKVKGHQATFLSRTVPQLISKNQLDWLL